MKTQEAREKVMRLNMGENIQSSIDYLDIFIGCYFDIVMKHHNDTAFSQSEVDARMLVQMMFSKFIHLRKILTGVDYVDENGKKIINYIVDPTIVASLIRNIYETVCLFNIVYVVPKSSDEKLILYNLWVISGLKYRQRFQDVITTDENKEKVIREQTQIDSYVNEIKNTQLFKDLDETNQNKILRKIKDKDYKIKIEDGKVRFLSWQEISKEFITKHDFFDTIYTYFSLYSHPSHVSVFQFAELFRKNDPAFKRKTGFNMRYCLALASIFITDYITLFPKTRNTFENRSEFNQIMINWYNKMLRGDEKSITELWKKLG